MDEVDISTKQQAEEERKKIIDRYNHVRLHSSLGFQPPAVYCRGNPEAIDGQRALKLRKAQLSKPWADVEADAVVLTR